MDPDPPPPSRPKRRFAPRAPPPSRRPKPPVPKTEDDGQEQATRAGSILQRFTESVGQKKSKVEKKSSVQVAFQATTSSNSIRSFGIPEEENEGKSSNSGLRGSPSDIVLPTIPSSSARKVDEEGTHLFGDDDTLASKTGSKYKEPWDYQHSYYPTVLPLRKPLSSDPELLDAAEFGETTRNKEYNGNTIKPAEDLGLTLGESDKEKMLLFKLPTNLPLVKQPTSIKGKEKVGSSTSMGGSKKHSVFKDLSEGYMGKMLVYKSGAIKLKLGETLYDVSPGLNRIFPEDVTVINTKDRQCCVLGSVDKHVVVTPDVDSLLTSILDFGHKK